MTIAPMTETAMKYPDPAFVELGKALAELRRLSASASAMLAALERAREVVRASCNGEPVTDYIGTIVEVDAAIAAAEAAGIKAGETQ